MKSEREKVEERRPENMEESPNVSTNRKGDLDHEIGGVITKVLMRMVNDRH